MDSLILRRDQRGLRMSSAVEKSKSLIKVSTQPPRGLEQNLPANRSGTASTLANLKNQSLNKLSQLEQQWISAHSELECNKKSSAVDEFQATLRSLQVQLLRLRV